MFRKKKQPETYVVVWDESYEFEVVGESHRRDNLLALISRAPADERDQGEVYTLAHLVREPHNQYDSNAVRVEIDGLLVGYIPGEYAEQVGDAVAYCESNGGRLAARACIGWSRYRDDAPIGVRLDFPDPDEGSQRVEFRPLSALVEEKPTAMLAHAGVAPEDATATQPVGSNPPAAWYPDPSGERRWRWWDGAAWSDHYSPM